MLDLAYKNIKSIDCQIKSTILSNLEIIRKNNSDLEDIKSRGLTGSSTDTYQTRSDDENYAVRGGIIGGIIGFLIYGIVGSIIVGLIGRAIGSQIKK